MGDDDLANIQERRRPENRLGFALQLCALRYPGRALAPGEMIPHEVLSFIGAQLGVPADALLTYAARRQTRQQHMEALREIYGYKTFTGRGARDLRIGFSIRLKMPGRTKIWRGASSRNAGKW